MGCKTLHLIFFDKGQLSWEKKENEGHFKIWNAYKNKNEVTNMMV